MSDQELKADLNRLNELHQTFSIDQLKDLSKLLSILSKFEALTIFLLAEKGLKVEPDNPSKIGLSKKQYYTRLKQLVDYGLIKKRHGSYFHTTMGKFVYGKHVLEHLEGAKNAKEMRMIDVLKETRNFSEEEISSIIGQFTHKTYHSKAPNHESLSSPDQFVHSQ